jgi:hypothetical protein
VTLIEDSFVENVQPPTEYAELCERLMHHQRLCAAYERIVGTGIR